MKKSIFIIALLFLFAANGVSAQGQDQIQAKDAQEKISMYYFHTSFRCVTCRTVEAESKQAFESLYPEQFKSGDATFQAINIEEEENKNLVEQFQITGQTLLLVKGEHTKDLTNQGFLYAKTSPEKLKEEIRKAAENL